MQRKNIQLLALARQGDPAARCEAGRSYLLGVNGFPHHVKTGIEHLTHDSLRGNAQAARIVCESLPLQQIIQFDLVELLAQAAVTGSAVAKVKFAVWLLTEGRDRGEAMSQLSAAAASGHLGAMRALRSLQAAATTRSPLRAALTALGSSDDMDVAEIALVAARSAREASDLDRLLQALDVALSLRPADPAALDELIVAAVRSAELMERSVAPLTPTVLEASLDRRAHQGDGWAAYTLGRALCGIECGGIAPEALVAASAVRRGTALLFRAADAGHSDAWMQLYRLLTDQKLSVANSQLARFCLEKAAAQGVRQAQTKLGALMLRSAVTLADSEQAITWLHEAATQDDAHARELLASLHLKVSGSEAQARVAVEQVRRDHPWLAMRMQLARDFGLTKLEALCVDPVDGLRPWGLVVGKNPFIAQSRRSQPRAIPAVTPAALDHLRRMAMMFSQLGHDAAVAEGDARRRSLVQRRAFARLALDERMFFANASSSELDTLRQGSRWAFHAKRQLQLALAA
jgi:TPR repeat protein